jgi:hypothetical protein
VSEFFFFLFHVYVISCHLCHFQTRRFCACVCKTGAAYITKESNLAYFRGLKARERAEEERLKRLNNAGISAEAQKVLLRGAANIIDSIELGVLSPTSAGQVLYLNHIFSTSVVAEIYNCFLSGLFFKFKFVIS